MSSFHDVAMATIAERPGTGGAFSKVMDVYTRCKDTPKGRRLILNGHAANRKADGTLELNFSDKVARDLQEFRLMSGQLMAMLEGISLEETYRRQRMRMGPLEGHIRFEEVDTPFPAHVRDYYMNIIRDLPRDLWPALCELLRSTQRCCVPLALLQEAMGMGPVVLGKLGFSDTDWEYGETGVFFK